LYLDMSKAVEI